jgi:hypothetical protein
LNNNYSLIFTSDQGSVRFGQFVLFDEVFSILLLKLFMVRLVCLARFVLDIGVFGQQVDVIADPTDLCDDFGQLPDQCRFVDQAFSFAVIQHQPSQVFGNIPLAG